MTRNGIANVVCAEWGILIHSLQVPCYRRASELETDDNEEQRIVFHADAKGAAVADDDDNADDDAWIATHRNFQSFHVVAKQSASKRQEEDEIQDMEDDLVAMKIAEGSSSKPAAVTAIPNTDRELDGEEIPDMEDFGDMDNMVEEDPAALPSSVLKATTANATTNASKHDNIVRFRTYDMYISYDKYYQTPRMWLFGYDEVCAHLIVRSLVSFVRTVILYHRSKFSKISHSRLSGVASELLMFISGTMPRRRSPSKHFLI